MIAFLLLTGSCRDPEHLTPLTIDSLAAAWSGGRTDPTCQNRGPRGEFLGTEPGAEYCQWPTLVQGRVWGTVGAYRDHVNGDLHMLWERVFLTDTARSRVVDSLSRSLRAHGLEERPCRDRGYRWESGTFTVDLSRHARPDGSLMLTVFVAPGPLLGNTLCERLSRPRSS